jgi:hypothetical protein
MSWRTNALALQALATQGYLEDEGVDNLDSSTLARTCADIFLEQPAQARTAEEYGDVLEEVQRVDGLGFTKEQLLDRVIPGFRAKTELTEDEGKLLDKEGDEAHPDLAERVDAITALQNLLWGTMCKDGRTGEVQQILAGKGYLLVVIAKAKRANVQMQMKVATNDPEMILRHFVDAKGAKLVSVSSTVRKDVRMVTDTFPAMTPKVKAKLGVAVTAAMMELTEVADINANAIAARQAPSISSGK